MNWNGAGDRCVTAARSSNSTFAARKDIDNSGKNLIAAMFADGVEVVVPTKHSTRVQ